MGEESGEEKLAIVLEHWMEHNRGHVREFVKWSEKARGSGHEKTADGILEAARQMERANEALEDALRDLGDR